MSEASPKVKGCVTVPTMFGRLIAGVRAIIAESFNNAHRRNLIGMGIWPLRFVEGQSAETLGLRGDEEYTLELPERIYSRMPVQIRVCHARSGLPVVSF